MNLKKKKILAAKALGVGKHRIIFNTERLSEIKEALTKQDIRDLYSQGAILIKPIKGRRKIVKRKNRRRGGSKRHTKKRGKKEYVILTRKLRNYLKELRRQNKITPELYFRLRKEIRASLFKSKAHMKEHIASIQST